MSNNILLNAIFEPHVMKSKELPCIIHVTWLKRRGVYNVHQNIEILYIMQGTGRVINGTEEIPVCAGDAVIVDSYAPHCVIPDGELQEFCLIPDYNFCKSNGLELNGLHFSPVVRSEWISAQIGRVLEEFQSVPHRAFRAACLKSMILELLVYLGRNHTSPRAQPRFKEEPAFERVRKGIDYIKNHLDEQLTLETVAESAGVSKYYFLRIFKQVTGYTLSCYINLIRCEYAKQLLESGGFSVRETARQCGFENDSYFTTVFKKHIGSRPSEYLAEKKQTEGASCVSARIQ